MVAQQVDRLEAGQRLVDQQVQHLAGLGPAVNVITQVDNGQAAAETVGVMMSVFRRLDPTLRKTVTFDNDTTFANHGLLRSMFNMIFYLCAH